MPPTTDERAERILRSAKTAVSTLSDIAHSSQTPFLNTAATISLSILTRVESLKLNKQDLVQMTGDIHDILCHIITLHVAPGGGVLPLAVLQDIGYFTETLNKIQILMQNQLRTRKIRRLFRQSEEAAQLEACKAGLKRALDIFGAHSRMSVSAGLEVIRQDAQTKHDEILGLLEDALADTDTDSSYSARRTLSSLGDSSGSLSLLPGSPKIFHGREAELRDVINILLGDRPRLAVLGPGGMGKTSLAMAALHDPDITNKYLTRYFVFCDSAVTSKDLVSLTASNLSLEPPSRLAKVVVHHLSSGPPCLLVLDNFETPWEPVDGRTQVEEFLSLLSDVPHVALLITMRGAERPSKVRWTRPFLPPLTPLSRIAARQTFIDIADDTHDDSDIDELISLTDNLPLALNLIANVAGSEGCAMTLA
ncbi:P-loop containing nucleoside triphosphate hydrolase protein [Mycena rosella]|uniref:P-loop containing nucleoside triphosphate hydrolase protein n=1 Tax=Mycena rosella TaxID=1033263 RepID=A0AAD7GEN4_MYCRO|nr:P-loop containing nucleoside triphosphate hydrolase protein [Mycena rosella]